MWLWVTFFARFSLFFLFFLHWLLDWLLVFDFVACSSGEVSALALSWSLSRCCLRPAFVLLSASCYLLFANLRCLFTIIQSIIQFNARFVSPGVAIYSIIHSVTFEKGAICVFSQLLFTVFFFFYSAVRIFFRSVLYTSSSSFTGPQMRQKFSCLCLYASVCVVTCGELTDAANISEFTRILCTFSSFKTVSNRAAAALLLPLPLLLLLFLASSVVKIDGLIRPVGCLCGRWRSFRGDNPVSFPFMARICALSTTTDVSQHYQKIIDWQTKARSLWISLMQENFIFMLKLPATSWIDLLHSKVCVVQRFHIKQIAHINSLIINRLTNQWLTNQQWQC